MVDAAFRDLEAALQDIVAEDDRVAARVRLRGQHRGEFAGVQPTDCLIQTDLFEIVRVEQGRPLSAGGCRPFEMLQMGAIATSPPGGSRRMFA
jgi:predicted ester cyclase